MLRGDVWWASLPPPVGYGPGDRHPVVIVQDDQFNQSRLRTVIVVVITSNLIRIRALAMFFCQLLSPALNTIVSPTFLKF